MSAIRHGADLIGGVTVHTGTGNVTVVNESIVVVKKDSGAATTVNLPAVPSNLRRRIVVVDGKGDAATNNITVDANSTDTINGASTDTISENYGAAAYVWNGTEWNVEYRANPLSSTELGFLNGVTAGTAAASKALVLDANSAITSGLTTLIATTVNATSMTATNANATTFTGTTGVFAGLNMSDIGAIAAAGSAQGNATAITNRVSIVSAADNAKGVILPAGSVGDVYLVYSSAASNGLLVYPPTNGTINDGSANASIAQEGRTAHLYLKANATNWINMGLLNA